MEIKLDISEISRSDMVDEKNLAGIFSKYADSLSKKENQAWSIAVKEKHVCNNAFS